MSRIKMVEGSPHRCEWALITTGTRECAYQAVVALAVKGSQLAEVCWAHADEIMMVAGLSVPAEEHRQGWALWKKDTAQLRFDPKTRDRLWA